MNPADFSLTISPSLTKAVPATAVRNGISAMAPAAGKTGHDRINAEPVYTQLKNALGVQWSDYKAAIGAFITGSLNQAELTWVLQPLLSAAPSLITSADSNRSPVSLLHLHNQLVMSIYGNALRDPPQSEVAPYVVATDKPSATAKSSGAASGTNDKNEEKLKKHTMGLHARDRQRIKGLKDAGKPVNNGFQEMQDYMSELAVKPLQTSSGGHGEGQGLARSNFDIEIRRRYAQSLASEQLEFPSLTDLQNRIEPICYEEGLIGGVQQGSLQTCAELIEQATEVYMKEMITQMLTHARSNAAAKEGIQTHKFRKQLRKEEDDAERGILQRNAGGLLPIEMQMQASREPLRMHDLRLAQGLSDTYLRQDRFLAERVMLSHYPELDRKSRSTNGNFFGNGRPLSNGVKADRGSMPPPADPNAMDVDDFDYGQFKGVTTSDHDSVMSALDDCLLAAG